MKRPTLWQRLRAALRQPPAELAELHTRTLALFIYQKQPNEWAKGQPKELYVWPLGKAFMGDCDDFAATMAHALGPEASFVVLSRGSNREQHAVCFYKGWVSDNEVKQPYPIANVDGMVIQQVNVHRLMAVKAMGYQIKKKG
jgi:hypothetical protein